MMNLIVAFRNFAKAPKKFEISAVKNGLHGVTTETTVTLVTTAERTPYSTSSAGFV
jgi:hypothetical protein